MSKKVVGEPRQAISVKLAPEVEKALDELVDKNHEAGRKPDNRNAAIGQAVGVWLKLKDYGTEVLSDREGVLIQRLRLLARERPKITDAAYVLVGWGVAENADDVRASEGFAEMLLYAQRQAAPFPAVQPPVVPRSKRNRNQA